MLTEEDSTTRSSEPGILIADACSIGPRNNAVVVQSFTFKCGVCKRTLRNNDCSLAPASAHACGSHHQVLLHKRHNGESAVWQSNAEELKKVVLLFWRYPGAAQCLVAILSMPDVDSMELMSPRLLPALFHAASRMPCLTSCSHQHSSRSNKTQWRSSFTRKDVRCLPIPIQWNTVVDHRPSLHHSRTVPDTVELSESFWSLLCHAPQLSQTSISCILHGIIKVKNLSTIYTTSTSAFRSPQSCHCRPECNDQSRHGHCPTKHAIKLWFVCLKWQWCPSYTSGNCNVFCSRGPSATSLEIPFSTPELNSE